MADNKESFFRKNGKVISNIAVVAVVLLAIYVKINDKETAVTFGVGDAYAIAGVFLAFLFLFWLKKRRQK